MRPLILVLSLCGLCVPAGAASVSAASYVALAQRTLQNALQPREGRLELQARGVYRDLDLPALHEVELRARIADSEPAPSALVWIEVLSRGRVERRIPVAFHVDWYRTVLTARTALKARSKLD